jgi:hypothetical protein
MPHHLETKALRKEMVLEKWDLLQPQDGSQEAEAICHGFALETANPS